MRERERKSEREKGSEREKIRDRLSKRERERKRWRERQRQGLTLHYRTLLTQKYKCQSFHIMTSFVAGRFSSP